MTQKKPPPAVTELTLLRHRPPLAIFGEWLAAAAHAGLPYPEAMTLATADAGGMPQARTVLLKEASESGMVFFTNRDSRKGQALRTNGKAALLFYWQPLGRQVLVEGTVTELPRPAVAEYFSSRPRQSQIGAWASAQSQAVESPAVFAEQVRAMEVLYAGQKPPLPPHWSGFCVSPQRLEFWQEGEFRLHQRLVFWRNAPADNWQSAFLQP